MNCKQGDLAIIIFAGTEEHLGKIVTCKEHFVSAYGKDSWIIDPPLPPLGKFWDSSLRPIRHSDELDETLSWKELPINQLESDYAHP